MPRARVLGKPLETPVQVARIHTHDEPFVPSFFCGISRLKLPDIYVHAGVFAISATVSSTRGAWINYVLHARSAVF